jgi:Zn-dependent peptidase ImmA (M78 family)
MTATTCIGPAPEFADAEPSLFPKPVIESLAEEMGETLCFKPGDSMEGLVKQLGGKIVYQDVEDWLGTEAGSIEVWKRGKFIIYLSRFTSHLRDRFTMAHELGHYVLHSNFGQRPIRVARDGSTRVEWEANWFAAGFLMPRKKFIQAHKMTPQPRLLSAKFDVSIAAAQVRMDSLGLT